MVCCVKASVYRVCICHCALVLLPQLWFMEMCHCVSAHVGNVSTTPRCQHTHTRTHSHKWTRVLHKQPHTSNRGADETHNWSRVTASYLRCVSVTTCNKSSSPQVHVHVVSSVSATPGVTAARVTCLTRGGETTRHPPESFGSSGVGRLHWADRVRWHHQIHPPASLCACCCHSPCSTRKQKVNNILYYNITCVCYYNFIFIYLFHLFKLRDF